MRFNRFNLLILVLFSLAHFSCADEIKIETGGKPEYDDSKIDIIRDAFDTKREDAFLELKGKPLKEGEILGPISGTGVKYYRTYCYSLIDFAAKCFWLEEMNSEANEALIKHCEIFDNSSEEGKDWPNMRDGDSFYWASDELCRIVEYWGTKGIRKAGLLKPDVEAKILHMMWIFVKDQSYLKEYKELPVNGKMGYLSIVPADFSQNNTWDVEGSENHHIMRFYTKWHFSKLLKDLPEYKDLKSDDGHTPLQHYEAWTSYIKQYIKERAKKGLFVEFANDLYGMESLKCIYTLYDFGDKEIHDLTGKFLDVYWASWGQEQIDGVRGGSKARIYQGLNSMRGDTHFRKLAWYNFGIGGKSVIKENIFSFITSNYRMQDVVMDIVLDAQGKGDYEVQQRKLGLSQDGKSFNIPYYRFRTDAGLVRYSYCTPNFIMGTFHCEALPSPILSDGTTGGDEWTMLSSQNRWMGVIFEGNHSARIYPQCVPEGSNRGIYNQHWGVQKKGCMIVQKMKNDYSKYAKDLRVWVSDFGRHEKASKDGWFFASYNSAYAAIKFVSGGYKEDFLNDNLWPGYWLTAKEEYSPVIIEVDKKSNYSSFDEFQNKIISLNVNVSDNFVEHTTLYGDNIKFYTDFSKLAEVNGETVNLTPSKVMDSPYIQSDYDSGIYTIKKGGRSLVIDFNVTD